MIEYGLQITIFFHFIGLGLLVTTMIAGLILEIQFRKIPNLTEKVLILKLIKRFSLLSPVAVLIMLISGIGNMEIFSIGIFTFGWLTAKLIFFAILATNGILFGILAGKRGALVGTMMTDDAPPDAELQLKNFNKQITMFHIVTDLLFIIILALAVYGLHGGGYL